MSYPGQKYRQKNGNNSLPGNTNGNNSQYPNYGNGYNPPNQANSNHNQPMPPPYQNHIAYNNDQGNFNHSQSYNQSHQEAYNNNCNLHNFNPAFPQPHIPNSYEYNHQTFNQNQNSGYNSNYQNSGNFNGNLPSNSYNNNMSNNFPSMPQPQSVTNFQDINRNFNTNYNNPPQNSPPNHYSNYNSNNSSGMNHSNQQFHAPPPPPPQNYALYQQPPNIIQAPQNAPLPPGCSSSIPVSNFSGRKKALLIGINYFNTKSALRGCINDVKNVKDFICKYYSFSTDAMVILTDDQKDSPTRMPTRANIIMAMNWLVEGAQPNDSLFFHFSGHGSQQEDLDGDEDDGFDETICPLDYERAGMIVDDEMNLIMCKPLPPGCRLTAIFDCCHSGTALDLPYVYDKTGKLISYSPAKKVTNVAIDLGKKYLMGDMVGALMSLKNGVTSIRNGKKAETITQNTRGSYADVVMFSGCDDSQTSADAVEQGIGNTGAMSYALLKALATNPYNMSYIELLDQIRTILRGKYTQIPQLSSGRPMDMNRAFNM